MIACIVGFCIFVLFLIGFALFAEWCHRKDHGPNCPCRDHKGLRR